MPVNLDAPNLAANTVSLLGAEHVHKVARRFNDETIETSPAQQSQVKKTLKRQYTARQISNANLSRLLTTARKGQATDAEAAASRIADFYDKTEAKLPDFPEQEKLLQLAEELRNLQIEARKTKSSKTQDRDDEDDEDDDDGGAEASEGTRRKDVFGRIMGSLGSFDSDVSHQSAAFDFLRSEVEEEDDGDGAFLGALSDVQQYFDAPDVRAAVKAGYAVAPIAHERAATLKSDPAAVRDAYRTLIRDEKDFAKVYDALLQFDPLKNCEAVLGTFILAAGADLSNLTGPSTDAVLLRALLIELGKLKKLRTVLDGCAELIVNVDGVLPEREPKRLKAPELASRLLHFIGKTSASQKDAGDLLGNLSKSGVEPKLVFYFGVDNLLTLVPDDVFPSMEARLKQKTALRDVSSKLVTVEEQEVRRAAALAKGARTPKAGSVR